MITRIHFHVNRGSHELDLRPGIATEKRGGRIACITPGLPDFTERYGSALGLVDTGALKPVIDRVFPLSDAAEAHRYLEMGRARGKVVLSVREG
ncbi:MAG: zinc-binding dehydrogenase [Archangium sp.]|nr:zinc-binding dehydrogenase [Archangium sp.]